MLQRWPTGRRVAITTVICLAVALTVAVLVQGLSNSGWLRALEVLAIVLTCAAAAGLAIGLIVSKLAHYEDPEDEAAKVTLDRVRTEFDAASGPFGAATFGELARLERELARLREVERRLTAPAAAGVN